MSEKPDGTNPYKLKGRDRQNLDLYASTPKQADFAKRKAEQLFQIITSEEAPLAERARVREETEADYLRGEAFADMANYVLTEAYGHMMDIKDEAGRAAFFQDIYDGLNHLIGVDGLEKYHVDELRRLWLEVAQRGVDPVEFTEQQRQQIEASKAKARAKAEKEKNLPIPDSDVRPPGAQ